MLWPTLFALVFLLIVVDRSIGFLVLRRRGVYFSLLTLAFSALVYSVAFRWTAFTGGENGLGGVTRASWLGADLENPLVVLRPRCGCAGLAVVYGLSRFHRSPIGTVLNAIRENEQRAQFIGYATHRYKLVAFVLSSVLTGFAGVLFAFHHRFASADPTAVSLFRRAAGDGDHRRHAQPARTRTGRTLLHPVPRIPVDLDAALAAGSSACCSSASSCFRRAGLVGVWQRLTAPLRRKSVEAAAMAGRAIEQGVPLPAFLQATRGRRRSRARGARTGQVLRRHPCLARCERRRVARVRCTR